MEVGVGTVSYKGLITVLIRGIINLGGHMAYAGIFGYFIGLAVMRRAAAPRLFVLGWLSAAALHGTWDAIAFSAPGQSVIATGCLALVALLSYAWLASCILKARKISPTRHENFATVVVPAGPRTSARGAVVP